MIIPNAEVEILLPVHNEGDSIEAVLREIHAEISPKVAMQFIVCEDGSVDHTKEVLRRLDRELPMKLMIADERKGYSRAVRDGMQALSAPYLLCLDSDGQCDPKDFWQFWDCRQQYDVVLGRRVHRADHPWRRICSRGFYLLYQVFYHVPVHDPSCPYMLAGKDVIARLVPELGAMQQGFWWEFMARAHRRGFSIRELPVQHRERFAGDTQVYKLRKLPGIGVRHFAALFKIWRQTRSGP
ncbi:MAG: glycosyltransferase family 2 protein [Thermoguttaceae bacterium]